MYRLSWGGRDHKIYCRVFLLCSPTIRRGRGRVLKIFEENVKGEFQGNVEKLCIRHLVAVNKFQSAY